MKLSKTLISLALTCFVITGTGAIVYANDSFNKFSPSVASGRTAEVEVIQKESHEQNLNLHISKPQGQNYMVYKKIEDNETVKTVMDILLNVPWENAKVLMSRQPDYKIVTVNVDPTISYEPVTYAVWLSPNKDILEVIIEGQSKYGKVTKEDTKKLLSILETH